MVINGIDCIENYDSLFAGKRVGLLTSVTGLDRNHNSTINVLHKRYGLTAIFGPEHGVRGSAMAGAVVDDYIDEETGVKVYSLYKSNNKHFTEDHLKEFDVLVYDVQDVGARFYTYISSLCYAIEDIAKAGKELVVLDRVNPLGDLVEGTLLRDDYKSFVGAYNVPTIYGLTCGEFALMYNKEMDLNCKLSVVKCEGWERSMQFPDTGLLHVLPSPNLPNFESVLAYPGTCIFEGTNFSEGRGTTLPFQTVGAPYVNATRLAAEMNRKELPGVWFRPVYFIPSFSKHAQLPCEGVQIHVTDRRLYRPVTTGYELLYEVIDECSNDFEFLPAYREGGRPFADLLFGDRFVWKIPPREKLLERSKAESEEFRLRKREFELYK